MSIAPLPDPLLPSEPADAVPPSESFHLSSLDRYAGQPGGLIGVGFWLRAGARVIDLIAHYVITFAGGILFGIVVSIAAAARDTSPDELLRRGSTSGITLVVFALLGSIVFEAVCEGLHGSTLGKLILGMTVVQEDGTPCRFGSALIRSFAYLVDSLFFGLIGYLSMQNSPQQQRHGDNWAHTVVVRRADVSPSNRRGGGTFVGAFLLGAMADAILAITAMLIHYQ